MIRGWFDSCMTCVAVIGFLLLSSVGCGFVLTKGPPEGHERMDSFSCTEGKTGPSLDLIYAGSGVVLGIAAASEGGSSGYGPSTDAIVPLAFAEAALYTASGIAGLSKVKKCRAAKLQLADRQAQATRVPPQPNVGAPIVQSVVVSPAADTLAIGDQLQLVATALAPGGEIIPNLAFTWSSLNDPVLSVSAVGLVTAHAKGMAVIAASTGSLTGTANILVVGRH